MWISDDDILVVNLKTLDGVEGGVKIGFGPSGARVTGFGQAISWSRRTRFEFLIDSLLDELADLGLERRRQGRRGN